MNDVRPLVGVGIMILRDGKVLLGQRLSKHGAGEWQFPGGHLEYMESFEECARREAKEEADVEVENVKFQFLGNVKKYGKKHYIQIGLIADYKSGIPKVMEPDKTGEWDWYDLDNLPSPMFAMCDLAIESYKTGQNYFDS